MRAEKHLELCTEKCKYNTTGKCSFGIRLLGCYLDEDVRQEAERIVLMAKEVNSIEAVKSIARARTYKNKKVTKNE